MSSWRPPHWSACRHDAGLSGSNDRSEAGTPGKTGVPPDEAGRILGLAARHGHVLTPLIFESLLERPPDSPTDARLFAKLALESPPCAVFAELLRRALASDNWITREAGLQAISYHTVSPSLGRQSRALRRW